jgi:hypothetical protein
MNVNAFGLARYADDAICHCKSAQQWFGLLRIVEHLGPQDQVIR